MQPTTGRKCPKCESTDYVFKGRKKLPTQPGQGDAMETKYACRGCGHEWKAQSVGKVG